MDDNLDKTKKLDLSDLNEKPYKGTHRKNNRKALTGLAVAFGVIVLMIGVLLNMGGDDNKPIANEYPIIGTPTSTASPTKKPTKNPSPTPTRTKTPTPKATPVAPTRSTVPSSKPTRTRTSKPAPAKCVVRELEPKFEGKKYEGKNAVKALLKQNMAWNDIYYGEFDFPSQENKRQDMNELYNWMDGDRHERAAFDFFSLYHYNEGTIIERLKNVTGPCKELADLDRNWIEGIADLFKDPANNSSNPEFLKELDQIAIEWLMSPKNSRNAVLPK
jgi:hypothetical protein